MDLGPLADLAVALPLKVNKYLGESLDACP
jgi:hypothetical protein